MNKVLHRAEPCPRRLCPPEAAVLPLPAPPTPAELSLSLAEMPAGVSSTHSLCSHSMANSVQRQQVRWAVQRGLLGLLADGLGGFVELHPHTLLTCKGKSLSTKAPDATPNSSHGGVTPQLCKHTQPVPVALSFLL
jgi:hypothetical protein